MPPKDHSSTSLIDQLVDGLEPVRPMRVFNGMGWVVAGLGLTMAGVLWLSGKRHDLAAGTVDPVFLLSTGLYLLLGVASAMTVIDMSRPRVGTAHGGWIWAAAMTALLPASAVIIGLGEAADAFSAPAFGHGLTCLATGCALSVLTFAILVWWLRRGAPTSPERAGLVTGVAAGCFGISAFSLHCDYGGIVHIGLWHSAVVVVCALTGRLVVPRLVRW